MDPTPHTLYLLAADAVLVLHLLVVVFVVIGLVTILLGALRHWHWVRNPWFRAIHLAAIGGVVLQSWIGVVCPLTELEMALRTRGGDAVYSGGFVAHWVHAILYYQAPEWVFTLIYTVFGLAVLATWRWVPPDRFRPRRHR